MSKLKFKRASEMCQLEKEIISYLFQYMERKPQDRWYKYNGEFKYEDKVYDLECECRWDNNLFTYRNLHIQHKQKVIEIDDMIKQGLLH